MTTKDYCTYILDALARVGNFTARSMMGGYCIYMDGKLVADICDNRLLVKQTETSKRMLAGSPEEYPYEGSRTLMFVIEDPENTEKMQELFEGLFKELPEKKKK